eukprot:2879925-Prymnesium_polylepis.1
MPFNTGAQNISSQAALGKRDASRDLMEEARGPGRASAGSPDQRQRDRDMSADEKLMDVLKLLRNIHTGMQDAVGARNAQQKTILNAVESLPSKLNVMPSSPGQAMAQRMMMKKN